MKYTELVERVQRRVREPLPYSTLDTILRACFIVMICALEEGEAVYVPGFGYFEINTTSAQTIIGDLDSRTQYQIIGRKKVHFQPSPSWVDELNGKV